MPYWDKRQVAPGVKLQWGPLSAPHLYGFLQMQNAVMGAPGSFPAGWMQRQQDFADLAFSTAVEISTTGIADPGRTLTLVADLQKASAQHLSEEIRGYAEMMTHFMGIGSTTQQDADRMRSAKPAAKVTTAA